MKQKRVIIINSKDRKINKSNTKIRTKVSTKNYKVNRIIRLRLFVRPDFRRKDKLD